MSRVNVLFIGDVIGALGRKVLKEFLPGLKAEYRPDCVVLNGENSAHGYGITLKIYEELVGEGIDIISMGNHVFDKKELLSGIDKFPRVARPANYPKTVPGNEYVLVEAKNGARVALVNLLGRVFMPPMDCPFQAIERLLPEIKAQTPVILVDIHAEATSEKAAIGWHLDGKVSAVLGTHTHVMTADERVLPQGTAFISDIGMVGALDSVIGMNREQIMKRFLTGLPEKFEPADEGKGLFNAVCMEIDGNTGKALKIERIRKEL